MYVTYLNARWNDDAAGSEIDSKDIFASFQIALKQNIQYVLLTVLDINFTRVEI